MKRCGSTYSWMGSLFAVAGLLALLMLFPGSGLGQEDEPIEQPEPVLFEPDMFTSSETCGRCHQDIYEAWSAGSIHSQSAVEPRFRGALNRVKDSDRASCLQCHAPTALHRADYAWEDPITEEGITCDFCHSVKAVDLKAMDPYVLDMGLTKYGPIRNPGVPPHKAEYSELHTQSVFCAGCHEHTNANGVAVLSNYSEWQAGPYPARQVECQGCHMEFYKGKLIAGQDTQELTRIYINLHEVPGWGSLKQLRRAVTLQVPDIRTAGGESTVYVDVTNVGAGHKIPGGLSSHSIRLEVRVMDGGKARQQERVYRRVLNDGTGKEITEVHRLFLEATSVRSDNRIAPEETRKERFVFPPIGRGAEVEARLVYVGGAPWIGAEKSEIEIVKVKRACTVATALGGLVNDSGVQIMVHGEVRNT